MRWILHLLVGLAALGAGALAVGTSSAQAPAGARVLSDDSLRVVYWPPHRELAAQTLQAARSPVPLPGIPRTLALTAGTLVLAPSRETFAALAGGSLPSWVAGVAIPDRRLIILPPPSERSALDNPVVTLRHELAHLALNAYLPGRVPRWFDEGYATWTSGGWDQQAGWQLRLAIMLGRAPPLDSLALEWPRQAGRARLAYLLSASAVQHLATRAGEPAFAAFLEAWREQGDIDSALRSTYGLTLGQFEREWRTMVRRRYGWLLAISQVGTFWFLITLLLLWVGGRRRRRDREKLAAMEAEERMLPPAEWEEMDELPPELDGVPEEK